MATARVAVSLELRPTGALRTDATHQSRLQASGHLELSPPHPVHVEGGTPWLVSAQVINQPKWVLGDERFCRTPAHDGWRHRGSDGHCGGASRVVQPHRPRADRGGTSPSAGRRCGRERRCRRMGSPGVHTEASERSPDSMSVPIITDLASVPDSSSSPRGVWSNPGSRICRSRLSVARSTTNRMREPVTPTGRSGSATSIE